MTRHTSTILAVIAFSLFAPVASAAEPWDFDADFGTCGVARARSAANDVLLLPHGKILTAGNGLARYRRDGRLDRSFGTRGIVPDVGAPLVAAALQPDGKIVAVTSLQTNGDSDVVILRWLPGGAADTTFGDGGTVRLRMAGSEEDAARLVAQADGKLLVAVQRRYGEYESSALLVRLLSDGTPDPGFGDDGVVPSIVDMHAEVALAVQPDGGIVTAGARTVPEDDDDVVVERRLADGSLDPAFGIGGVATTRIVDHEVANVRALAVQPDGAIVVAGDDGREDLVFVRYLADGTVDPAFGDGGTGTAAMQGAGENAHLYDVVRQADGTFLAVGSSWDGYQAELLIVRLLPNGTRDPAFRPDAFLPSIEFTHDSDHARAITVAPDGKLVIAGDIASAPVLIRLLGNCTGPECRRSTCTRRTTPCYEETAHCTPPERARLQLRSAFTRRDDDLVWRWAGLGSASQFGDPRTDEYSLTVLDGCEGIAGAALENEDTCPSCWTRQRHGWSYEDGVLAIRLRADDRGRVRILVKVTGLSVPAPTAPLTMLLFNQMRSGGFACWQSFFDDLQSGGRVPSLADSDR